MLFLLNALGIVALRLIDVSLGALRIQYLVREQRLLAGTLGFFESLTWVAAAGIVLSGLDEWYKVVAYAAGYGLGTALGGTIDAWIASGQVFLRIMAPSDSPPVADHLRQLGFGVTVLNGEGFEGDVRLTLLAIPRRRQPEVVRTIQKLNPDAFVTVDAVSASTAATMKANRIRK